MFTCFRHAVGTKMILRFVMVLVLFFNLQKETWTWQCRKDRMVLTGPRGTITDGNGTSNNDKDYSNSSRCEWLIDGGNRSIVLKFKDMDTECSYDFLFIYDGHSHSSPLLASVSGDTLPKTIIAHSGYMLLYFSTDRNYQRKGFEAEFEVQDCPLNCHGNGECQDGECICKPSYWGPYCKYEACEACGVHGECLPGPYDGQHMCHCNPDYTGKECTLPLKGEGGKYYWFTLSDPVTQFPARESHSMVYNKADLCLYVFGGFDLNHYFNDLLRFCLNKNYWQTISQKEPWPSPRSKHRMVSLDEGFYVFGGMSYNESFSNELWFFNYTYMEWSLRGQNTSDVPPPLFGHTMTLVDGRWLYVIGGKLSDGQYSSKIWRYDVTDACDCWEEVILSGGRKELRMLVGHSAVFHPESRSILVFGGYQSNQPRFSLISSRLGMFHVDRHYWTDVKYGGQSEISPRAFHSAVIMGNYMVVVGGNIHKHEEVETCYDTKLHLFHLGCHHWVDHRLLRTNAIAMENGRFGHAVVEVFGNILIVAGGYSGYVLGDLIAHKLPAVIAPPQGEEESDYCEEEYSESGSCLEDLECIYCPKRIDTGSKSCIHKHRKMMCHNPQEIPDSCLGLCRALDSCHSCLIFGQGHVATATSPLLRVYQDQCEWQNKKEICRKRHVNSSRTNTASSGWWTESAGTWTRVEQCSWYDIPAGVRQVTWHSPQNKKHPDKISIIKKWQTDVIGTGGPQRPDVVSDFKGFIHPLNALLPVGETRYRVRISYAGLAFRAYISNDSSAENLEEVAATNRSFQTNDWLELRLPSGASIFPHAERGYKYLYHIEARGKNGSLSLEWSGNSSNINIFHTFEMEFLEQYHSGDCSQYENCMACMSDASCGWCPASHTCDIKGDHPSSCKGDNATHFLITAPQNCLRCEQHMDCFTCTQDQNCEWHDESALCARQSSETGRLWHQANCSIPCHKKTNCTSCISQDKLCFWCENTQTCLPFAHYISRFINGQCREWVDNDSKDLGCKNCPSYRKCSECIHSHGCGWCGNEENALIGFCTSGEFKGPEVDSNCSAILYHQNITDTMLPAKWSYDVCPDVDMCALGLHNCHDNATCIHRPYQPFECRCNRGFEGSGQFCEPRCYFDCIHGTCSQKPDYQCKCYLGYTGDDCNTSCDCNNHSTCKTGVGICDFCQHNTTGDNCELCKEGFYGNPSHSLGCMPCECHGHGVVGMGTCNATGHCFCQDNTVGDQCQECQDGYYGDPRNGGQCFKACDNPFVLNTTKGRLGSYRGSGVDSWHAYCVWIISPFSGNIQPKANSKFDDPTINVTIMDLNTKCGWDYVYVYDGIPDFLDGSPHSHGKLLGAFCGTQTGQSVLAKSGIVTVYYETDSAAHLNALSLSPQHRLFMGLHHMLNNMGFNASYHVNDCPSFCSPNQVCDQDACVCEVGHEGPNCDIYVCPSPCTYLQDHDSCVCQSNFEGGANYSVEVYPWFFPAVPRLTGVGFGEKNRFGHTLVTCGDGILYMFGGFSLEEGLLNDLWSYNTSAQQNPWKQMTYHLLPPNGRYYHAAACVPIKKQLFVFGGFVKQKNRYVATRELWRFSIGPFKWTKIDIPDWVPPLAGHTMTLVGDVTLLIVGGFSSENYFSDKLFMIDVNANGNEAWKSFSRQEMGGTVPLGLYGHTSVYQEPTNTVYIYGGMVYETDRFMVTDTLYVLSLDGDRMEWHTLQAEPGSQKTARIFHTAVDMEEFMVVLGGHDDQAKSAKSLLVYRYLCNFWHQFQFNDVEFSIPISNVLSPRAVRSNNSIYLMGGFDNLDHSEIVKLTLPMDTCSLLSNISSCLGAVGCSACTSIIAEGNRTQQQEHCFSNSGNIPEVCSSQEHGHRFQSGKQCSLQWYLERECYQYKNCSSCLAVYPRFRHSHLTCKWCTGCQGRCVSANVDCLSTRDMTEACVSEVYSRADQCSEAECAAAVCEKCASDRCVWSPTLKRRNPDSSTMLYTPNKQASWSCFHKSSLTDDDGMRTCPSRCHTHTDCHSCLQSNGGEGGSKKCIWSDLLQECMPPAYRPLHCSGGECGIIIQDAPTKCPSNCSTHQRCSECLQAPGCGWCALGGLNGIGICMRGGVNRPIGGQCDRQGVQPADGLLRAEMEEYMKSATGEPKWAFTECPMENECMNDHHDCDMQRQDCKDLTHSYKCECKKGYVWKDSKNMCEPVCHQGCENGMCTQPDVCDCQFGWVGKDCNTECKCNGYSNCISETQLHNCTHCINNTQGPDCGFCKVKYVGDPREKKPCVSCFEYCYNHTSNCVSSLTNRTTGIYGNPSMDSAVRELIHWHSFIHDQNGPKPDNAICLHCTNYTTGKRCEKCKEGYFRLETGDEFQPCMKCQCNGHSDKCSPSGGKNCLCSNNTDSPCESQKSDKSGLDECWKEQCSACKEYFMGNPARGHHCYRTMKVDINYCLDPYTQNKCDQNPGPLLQGRTVFFGVMPRFLNVDIRLTIDVFEGGVDIFFSNCDQTFVVDVNETGHHLIYLDKTLSVPHVHHALRDVPLNFEPYFSSKVSSRLKKMLYNSSSQEDVEFIDMRADQNHMYHRVEQTNTILRIYNVQSQLVITLPHHLGLKETRFFLVAHGSGSSVSSKTYGNLYFRQDQTHIDLFVFFSVFFSSFFLFLANCVLLWKLKQAIDTRRNRLERAKEMTLMASRPFARVLLHIDADARPIVSTPIPHRKPRFSTSRNPSVQASLPPVESLNTSFQPLLKPEAPFAVAAIATEPTETGQASVRTVMFQLPGGFAAPTKLCLGSALTTNYKASNVNTKIVTRRRPSSTVC